MLKKCTMFKAVYAVIFVLTISIMFVPNRCSDTCMRPGISMGDLIVSYRLNKNYAQNDLTVYRNKKINELRRVVAVKGDTVDIKDSCLIVNGYKQAEEYSVGPTNAYLGKIEFPITLKKGEVFLLADNRENASDSRSYGPVNVNDTNGVVLVVIRHRGL